MKLKQLWILCLALALSLLAACEQRPPQSPSPAPQHEPVAGTPPGAKAILDDSGLRPLDAPFEGLHPEGEGDPRAVKDLGPAGATLLFTASLKGYVEPCTCTLDTVLGGIDRIAGYVREFEGFGESEIIDAGDLLFEDDALDPRDVEQAKLKAALLVQAHRAMGVRATTPGTRDLTLGLDAYQRLLSGSGIAIVVANLNDSKGAPLGVSHRQLTIATQTVGVIGVVEPERFAAIKDVRATPAIPALKAALTALGEVDARVVVAQGGLDFARRLAAAAPEIDFIIIGHEPRLTDAVTVVGSTSIIEAYSQGRHLGVLKLYESVEESGRYQNARLGSASDVEKLDRRIDYLDQAISKAPPASPGNEPPMLKKLRNELDQLRSDRLKMSSDTVELPSKGRAFAYFSVPMTPGYPHDRAIWERKQRYNESLEKLYTEDFALSIPEAAPGQASYVGDEQCAGCHEDAHDVWTETPHSHAWASLVEKGKTFDPECVSCHVTGYDQPGGSIVGKVEGLMNVQCEACHGPGSIHITAPDELDIAGQVHRLAPAELCITCHDPANSPRFNYDTYLPLILGDGHGGEDD